MPRWDSNPQSQQASDRRRYAFDRTATGTNSISYKFYKYFPSHFNTLKTIYWYYHILKIELWMTESPYISA
jgi:hypothetical protein